MPGTAKPYLLGSRRMVRRGLFHSYNDKHAQLLGQVVSSQFYEMTSAIFNEVNAANEPCAEKDCRIDKSQRAHSAGSLSYYLSNIREQWRQGRRRPVECERGFVSSLKKLYMELCR